METFMHVRCFVLLGLSVTMTSSMYDRRCLAVQRAVKYLFCFQPTWLFDQRSRKCKRTCNGRGPFMSPDECDGLCRSIAVCDSPRPLSSCLQGPAHVVYYYDPNTRNCTRGWQCTYMGNNFPTMEECQETCVTNRYSLPKYDRCRLLPDHGRHCALPNRYGSPRFYYDPYHGRCYGFWYYGCGGNRNNFPSIQHCLRRCARPGRVPLVDNIEAGTGVAFFK